MPRSATLRDAEAQPFGTGRKPVSDRGAGDVQRMAEHFVQLWIRSDDDPSGIDWEAWLPKGLKVEHVHTRTVPWQNIQHEITWWITRRLTLDEWSELDDAESEVLARIVGDGNFYGTAGPVPDVGDGGPSQAGSDKP